MKPLLANSTPMIEIKHPLFLEKNVTVFLKLDFKRDLTIQGNKWHKLKLNIQYAQQANKHTLLTFGGAYSNHIIATAGAAHQHNLQSIGVIRGDELANNKSQWSHTLKAAEQLGMQFKFISRSEYRGKDNVDFLTALQQEYPAAYILPEGGTNLLAVQGFEFLMQEINQQTPNWTHLYTAVGTGGTLAGITAFSSPTSMSHKLPRQVIGVAVLKQADYLNQSIQDWIEQALSSTKENRATPPSAEWKLLTQYHHGGYAKTSAELINFKQKFENKFNIPLDPIYTSKVFYAFFEELKNDQIKPGSQVVLYHSGGLQGNKPPN